MKPCIVFVGPDFAYENLNVQFSSKVHLVHPDATQQDVAKAMTGAVAFLDASMKVHLTNDMFANSPDICIISCATTGSDHIDREVLDKRGVQVRTLREDLDLLMNLTPAAELSWGLLMACARKIPSALEHIRSGSWNRELFPGIMIKGKQLGIVGCGRIGGWMARYANAFGAEVVGYDPYQEVLPENVRRVSLEELFEQSDFISAHVHLTEDTKEMLGAKLFNRIKPGAIFINTSRSGICDEDALLSVLLSGRLGGAGLDVLNGEPDISGSPLIAYARTHDNLIITPHCGGFSPDAVKLVCDRAMGKIMDKLNL
ncbi:lactate dehydrogenase-like oxidoreductase [Desulfocapsa sulfexigens DSM 10523]|uniref:Lactate dehydrogenase-like oxidoreductase n=1 Tax=Desulfocapsa sulfexigens (strain DSM 10523 / SB164P1) TaxID=1167006 RepID=M1P696_DESSD|nr:NAD(P)-dependent oxidoreductase [Desulfocapsa sulfexigens]AGF78968.1 lactate dehydrogenase-like oxidoreductase [Desulfocapsa sulfexigens DSM 10523]